MRYFVFFLCSDGMRFFILIHEALVILVVALVLLTTVLFIRAIPPNHILRQYSFGVKLGFLSFSKYFQSKVSPAHIDVFRKFRTRWFIWGLALLGGTAIRIIYVDVLAPRVFFMFANSQCGK